MTRQTLLLVEDEPVSASSTIFILRRAGYEVVHANSGETALMALNNLRERVSMVIMDVNLGNGLSGPETAKSILEEWCVPIIFRSAYDDEEFVEQTERIASYGYVTKQAGVAVLLMAIKMAFRLYETQRRLEEKVEAASVKNKQLRLVNENLEHAQLEILRREEALWQSERRFRAITESAPIGMVIVSEGRIAYANPAAAQFFGAESPELIFGREIVGLIHPDALEAVYERVARLREDESVRDVFDHKWYRLDGSVTWGETVGEPIEYAGMKGAVVVIRDTNYRIRDGSSSGEEV